MNRFWRVARHEFRMTAANKAFVIMTILGPFLILAISVLPGLLSVNNAQNAGAGANIALLSSDVAKAEPLNMALKSAGAGVSMYDNKDAALKAVQDGVVSVVVELSPDYPAISSFTVYAKETSNFALFSYLSGVINAQVSRAKMMAANIDPKLIAEINQGAEMKVEKVGASGDSTEVSSDGYVSKLFTLLGFLMLLYMTTLLYGQLIGRSVVGEKLAKTVEIILSSVSPRELMLGKILGMGLAGLLQYGIWVGVSLVITLVAGPALNLHLPETLTAANLGFLVVFFILGYFMYASLYAAIGAAAEDEQHLAQLSFFVIIFLIVPVVMIGTLMSTPNSAPSVFMSYFPLTAPLVMLIRIMSTDVAAWQILVSIAVQLVSIFLIVIGAAKIFRTGILMTGKRPSIQEVFRWLAVKE